jgi:hypothetical protein
MSTIQELEKKLAKETSVKNLFIRYYYQHQEMLADLLGKYKDVQTTDFEHTQNQFQAMLEELQKQIECPVCREVHPPKDMVLNICGHSVCKECLTEMDKLPVEQFLCPLCKKRMMWKKRNVTQLGHVLNDGVQQTLKSEAHCVEYSQYSIVLIGDTFPYREQLKELGGLYNAKLKIENKPVHGWIFRKEGFVEKVQPRLEEIYGELLRPLVAKIPIAPKAGLQAPKIKIGLKL